MRKPPVLPGDSLSRPTDGRLSGSALIIVLAFLVILTGMIVAFFSSVTNEQIGTKVESNSMAAHNLADSVTGIVIAQLRDATVGYARNSNGSLNTNIPLGWASQPGLIHTFDTNAASYAAYKLYSSCSNVVTGSVDVDADLPGSNWWSNTALYTDLNSPVISQGYTNYAIFDPYLTNASNGVPLVEGFSISNSSGNPTLYGAPNPAAMPVLWLYMLRNGNIIAPDSNSTTVATFSNAAIQPARTNPIIARIAYWTDDESCKLNINTAGEGSHWGMPYFASSADVGWGLFPPAANEYNRYPGHPASTSLSPVLWSYLGLPHPEIPMSGIPGTPTSTNGSFDAGCGTMTPAFSSTQVGTYLSNVLTSVAPRYAWGGSMAGTMSMLTGGGGTPITTLSASRLYATVDELFFASTNPLSGRIAAQSTIGAQDAARMRFFLTTASRSPEVNPLNQPKLCLWPVPDATHAMVANPYAAAPGSNRTITDQTIAYCATLGTNAYYFTRYDATSANNDMTPRNQALYKYLRRQMDQSVPGFIGSFTGTGKWVGGTNSLQADQICTLLFDYIRSCINLVDSSTVSNTNLTASSFQYSYTTPPVVTSSTNVSMTNGTGQVVPIVITNPDGNVTRGIGRFPTLRGADLWFIARGANQPPLLCHTNGRPMVFNSGGTMLSASDGSMTTWNDVLTEFLGQAYAKVNPMHPWTCPYSSTTQLVPQIKSTVTIYILGFPISLPVPVFASVASYNPSVTNPLPNFSQLFPVFDLSGANTPGSPPTRSYPTLDGNSGEYVIAAAADTYFFTNSFISFPNPVVLATNTTLTASSGYTARATPGTASGIVTHPGLPYLTVQAATGTNAGAFSIPNPAYKDTGDNLQPGQTRIEMLYVPDFVDVAPGQSPLKPKLGLQAGGLGNFTAGGTAFSLAANPQLVFAGNTNIIQNYWFYDLGLQLSLNAETNTLYSTNKVIVSSNTFALGSFGGLGGVSVTNTISVSGNTVQTLVINFPTNAFPTPKLPTLTKSTVANYPPLTAGDLLPYWSLTFNSNDPVLSPSLGGASRLNQNITDDFQTYLVPTEMACSQTNASDPSYAWFTNGLNRITSDTIRGVNLKYGDPRMISCLATVPSTFFSPHPLYSNAAQITVNGWPTYVRGAHDLRSGMDPINGGLFGTLLGTNTAYSSSSGNSYFYPPPYSGGLGGVSGLTLNTTTNMFGYAPPRGSASFAAVGHFEQPYTGADCDFTTPFFGVWAAGGDFDNGMGFYSDGPFINKVDEGIAADANPSGIQINPYFSTTFKPTGTQLFSPNRMVPSSIIFGSLPVGFGSLGSTANPSPNILNNSWFTLQFSPNPNSPSAAYRDLRSAAAGYNEAGSGVTNPVLPDYVLLDFFQMPVVQPYPISDPFSMAGKVNMNYQIAPFTYINRDAALRGVFKSVMISAVDDQWGFDYKLRNTNSYYDKNDNYFNDVTARISSQSYNAYGTSSGNYYFHYPIHPGMTLQQFQQRFGNNDVFHSPSEICGLWLYPAKQPTVANPLAVTNALVSWDSANANIKSWWYGSPGVTRKSLTGDNVRERPYDYLYPRLTTKSNTYTVHYRVQVLQQVAPIRTTAASWQRWNDASDKVVADQRGSAMIERYIDPNDPTIPDFAGLKDASGNTLSPGDPALIMDNYYRYRTLNAKIFTP
jgi:uncharacterized protein (TIGR02600 family)